MNGGLNEIYDMNQLIQHHCEWLNLFVKDPQVAIIYWPIYRSYLIPILQKVTTIKKVMNGIPIDYCPWCKIKLPKNLYHEWFRVLEEEFNLDNPLSKNQQNLIPQEFKTDEWWKKRGL